MTTARAFRGFRSPAEIILWAVRWYLQFPVSSRDLERRLADRGVAVDHVTMYRWVQRFAPELERRMRRHLRPCRGPWHVDATSVRVGGAWRFTRHRRGRWLNNRVEPDHRRIKRRTRPRLGFKRFTTARRTLAGVEALAMLAKGQVRGVPATDMPAQRAFVHQVFGVAA